MFGWRGLMIAEAETGVNFLGSSKGAEEQRGVAGLTLWDCAAKLRHWKLLNFFLIRTPDNGN